MRALAKFIRSQEPSDLRRLLLALLVALLALVLGFHAVGLGAAESFIRHGGYWFMMVLMLMFCGSLWELWRSEATGLRMLWGSHRAGILTVLVCSAFVLSMDRFAYKVQFDEQVIQATAQNLHFTKEVGALVRAYTLGGSFLPIDAMMDKRPYLLPFLGSLLHDFTGYRTLNLFLFNAALVPVLLGLVYRIGDRLGGKRAGLVAVLALSTLPLLGQTATSAGMEMLNLTMLAATLMAALRYVEAPDARRLALLCLCSVLLSQCRYESVIFALPVCACILWGWRKSGRILLPWQACVTPLLFIPYALHNRVLSATPRLWQLNEGQSSRFSLSYLQGNLSGAVRYLFFYDINLSASMLLGYLGLLCVALLPWVLRRERRAGAALSGWAVFGLFAALIVGNLAMLMFYYWAQLNDPIASRFALPLYLTLALTIGYVSTRLLEGRPRAWSALGVLFLAYVMGVLKPAMAHAFYTEYNLGARVVEWSTEEIDAMPPRSRLVIANRSSLPFIIECQPSLPRLAIEIGIEKLRFHMEGRTFEEVLVLQTLRPGSVDGDYYIDPKDVLPEGWKTEVIAEKRFGAVLERISRLVALPPPKVEQAAGAQAAPPPAAASES
jgi:hypothetical protein